MGRTQLRIGAGAGLSAGIVFTLQGLRVLPSALMYGKPEWIVIGVALAIASGFVLWRSFRGDPT